MKNKMFFLVRMAKAKTDFTDYIQAFEDELSSFVKRVEERAKARIEKAKAEAEEVGPGRLTSLIVHDC